ncbi:hypothetical protein [Nostoc sp. CCY0012]|uniref:hypothetical protein n=1 Tax=Nostoc sp. CCY0012 TaxID=1056123 RepID=UPI0039C67CD0
MRTPDIIQQQAFQALLEELGQASPSEVKAVLDKREMVQPEEELTPEIVARFQQRIRNASKA